MTIRVGILIGTMSGGGAQRVALDLLQHLGDAGLEPCLISIDGVDDMRAVLRDPSASSGGRVFALGRNGSASRGTLLKAAALPRQWMEFRTLGRRLRLDVVISLMERANILNLLGGGGARRIISIHSHPRLMMAGKTWFKRGLIRSIYPVVLPRADRIVLVSSEAAQDAPNVFPLRPDRMTVIYNMCDIDRLESLARLGVPGECRHLFEQPVVLACGRLISDKGHVHLIRAMHALRDRTTAQLVILGDGPLMSELRREIERLRLEHRVFLPGFQKNALAWMARAQVFVLPSVREGLPMVLLEAMAAGTAVIAADCSSGPREILAPGTPPHLKTNALERAEYGLLTPAPDRDGGESPRNDSIESAMANAIADMLEDDDLRAHYEVAGRSRVRDFAPERIVPQWVDLIDQVLDQRARIAGVRS